MFKRVILLTSKTLGSRLERIITSRGAACETATSREELLGLEASARVGEDLLICANSGVIVPKSFLEKLGGMAYNFHAASPDFPGRDPHHFGVYRRAKRFGATAHVMTALVDDGAIVGVELFDVPADITAHELYEMAGRAQMTLFERMVPDMIGSSDLLPGTGDKWGERKSTREEFNRLCRLDPDIGREEFGLRLRAFQMPGYSNLYLDLYGRKFRIEPDEKG